MRILPAVLLLALLALPRPAEAQSVLDRTPNQSGGWSGAPWTAYWLLPHRFRDVAGAGVVVSTTFDAALGLPADLVAGARFSPNSAVVGGDGDEWELRGRWTPLREAAGPFEGWATAAYNGSLQSVDGELGAARWVGPLRLLAGIRGLGLISGERDARLALAGGAVWHPLPGRVPVALAGDAATLLDREGDEKVAWSAALQVGVSFTPLTLSLQASNAATTTLQGRSVGDGATRIGFELTIPVPAGRFFGAYPARDVAMEAVVEDVAATADMVRIPVRRYAFMPGRTVVPAGTTVEWRNEDTVVHTATAEDGTWDSGALRQGETWRARFDRPGIYTYECSPHPFMKGVIVVR
jgi:plastocyanin